MMSESARNQSRGAEESTGRAITEKRRTGEKTDAGHELPAAGQSIYVRRGQEAVRLFWNRLSDCGKPDDWTQRNYQVYPDCTYKHREDEQISEKEARPTVPLGKLEDSSIAAETV